MPLHALLFAAYPVLFLYSQNLGEAELGDVIPVLARIVATVAIILVAATLLLRDVRLAAVVVSATALAFLAFGHVESLLEPHAVPAEVQEAGWLAFIGLSFAAAAVAGRFLRPATSALNTLAAVLVALAIFQIAPHEWNRFTHPSPIRAAVPQPGGVADGPQRDIWYLVFDRYGSESSLRAGFGLDNDLPAWLRERGFYVADTSHANYVRTTLSLAATLNLDYWTDLAEQQGPYSEDYGPLHRMLQDHAVGRFLKERGYTYHHVGSWFGPTKHFAVADFNRVWEVEPEFETVLFETSALPVIERHIGVAEIPKNDRHHIDAALFQLRTLHELRSAPGPKFVMAHVLLPHDPYVFDADGRYMSKKERDARPESDNFRRQLAFTNERIRRLVDELLAVPEEQRPIIIIQADEGPYPPGYRADQNRFDWSTATPDDLEMKFGILNALYLPGVATNSLYPSITSVNTFRFVFDAYFGVDLPLVEDRVLTSRSKKYPYDLADITDRLPTLADEP